MACVKAIVVLIRISILGILLAESVAWEFDTIRGPHDDEDELIYEEEIEDLGTLGSNQFLRVTTIVEYPYLTLKENGTSLSGNERFEGYCKEILDLVADKVGFQYELHLVKDSRFGNMGEHGSWNGMIGEIIGGEADLAVSSMVLTRTRAEVVDFSVPFADFRLAVLMKREPGRAKPREPLSAFSFLQPMKPSLWILIIATTVAAIGCYFLMEYSVSNPGNVLSRLRQVATLLRCGQISRIAPGERNEVTLANVSRCSRSKGGFIIQIATISFLVIISAYMARYSILHYDNHMKSKKGLKIGKVESIEDLWYRGKAKIIVASPGSTESFLRKSSNPVHHGIHAQIVAQRNYVRSTMEGVGLVQNGSGSGSAEYAFAMEEVGAKYIVAQSCDLKVLPAVFGPKRSFAIAFPQNSRLRDAVNQALRHFKENGVLEEWGTKFRECGNHQLQPIKSHRQKKRRPINLNMGNMGGIFCFLIVAYFLSIVLGVGELFVKKRRFKARPIESEAAAAAPIAVIEEIDSSL